MEVLLLQLKNNMKNNKIILIIIVSIVIVSIITIIMIPTNENYKIKIKKVDDYSPDRTIVVLKNDKEFNDYKYIKYKDDDKDIILCYSENPTVNVFDLNDDDFIIVLEDKKEIVIKNSEILFE